MATSGRTANASSSSSAGEAGRGRRHRTGDGRRFRPLRSLETEARRCDADGQLVALSVDAALPGALQSVLDEHLVPGGVGLRVVVASAGSFTRGTVDLLDPSDWDAQLSSNLTATRVKLTDLVVDACVESEMSAGRDVAKLPASVVAETVTACLALPAEANWDRIDLGQLT